MKIYVFYFSFYFILSQLIIHVEKKYSSFNIDNFTKYIFENGYISKLEIGTPKQYIPLIVSFIEHYFYITHSSLNGIYDEKKSSSFKNISIIDYFFFGNFKKCTIGIDNIYFNNYNNQIQIYNKTKFLLLTDVKNKSYLQYSQIGLTKHYLYQTKDYNFIEQLKKNDYINQFTFYYKFIDNYKAKIIIGKLPHEIENDKFLEKNYQLYFLHVEDPSLFSWFIKFDSVKYFNIEKKQKIIFNIDFQGIFPPSDYGKILKQKFFDNYLNQNLCNMINNSNLNYYYFICDKKINIKNFEIISFYNKDLNFTFILDYNDVFIKQNNKYFCLILLDKKEGRFEWNIGEIFLRKYILIFNQEKGTIGFYLNYKNNKFVYFPWSLVLIFFTSTLILGFILYKMIIKKKRKIRANELEDNYDYLPKDYQKLNL